MRACVRLLITARVYQGIRACEGLVVGSIGNGSETLHCDGTKACYTMDLSGVSLAAARCDGTSACAYADFNNHTALYCDGTSACSYTFAQTLDELWCRAEYACYFLDVVDILGTLHCDGGDWACASLDAHSVGYLDCTASTIYIDYLCYLSLIHI